MSVDERVRPDSQPAEPPAEPARDDGVVAILRDLLMLSVASAGRSVQAVGVALRGLASATRSYAGPRRPPRSGSPEPGRLAARVGRARRSAGASLTTGLGAAFRRPDSRGAAQDGPATSAAQPRRRPRVTRRASRRAQSWTTPFRSSSPLFRAPSPAAPLGAGSAGGAVLSPPLRRRASAPALPLPGNPAAPRPRLVPEDGRPLVVKLGTVLIAAVAGAAAVVLVVGALVPRALVDLAGALQLDVILPQNATLGALEQPSRVYAADGTLLAELRAEVDREVVPLEDIPEHVRDAVIAAEDRRFYEHGGYSLESIGRAALTNLREGDVSQGGSTITQQIAKMNFLSAEQTLERKISELFYAVKLEEEFTKDELLERYLNEVYFGVSAYGIQAASQEYYGVDVQDLRIDQAALLAGVIPRPSAYHPRINPERALERRDAVLQDMMEIGAITQAERDAAQARDLDVIEHRETEVREPYVVAAVKRLFLQDPTFGATRAEREDRLFRGNLDITTTLDPELQSTAETVIEERFGSDGPTASIATVEPSTGAIVAFASGQEFDAEQFDYALQGRQQPGSAFKTFVTASALREGYGPSITLDGSSPIEVNYDGGTYEPENYGGSDYGVIDMRTGLQKSVNTYYVQLFEVVGRERAVEMAGELGIDVAEAIGTAADYGPSLVLGGLRSGVTPVEMAGAYATFANGGVAHRPYLIEQVVDGDGTELVSRGADDGREVLEPEVNATLVDMLSAVTAPGGTASGATIPGWETAGKTGTTNDNKDAWFSGFTPAYSTAVWVGHPDEDVTMPGATGGGTAAPVWTDYMRRIHADLEAVDFPDVDVDDDDIFPDGEVEVPDVDGLSTSDGLIALAEERLVGQVVRVNSRQASGTVIRAEPGEGSTVSPGDEVVLIVSTGQAPAPPPAPSSGGGGGNGGGGGGGGSDDSGDDSGGDQQESDGGGEPSGESGSGGGNGNGNGGGNGNGNGGDSGQGEPDDSG